MRRLKNEKVSISEKLKIITEEQSPYNYVYWLEK